MLLSISDLKYLQRGFNKSAFVGKVWLPKGKDIVKYAEVKPGDTVLDMGCGLGDISEEVFQKGAYAISLDF